MPVGEDGQAGRRDRLGAGRSRRRPAAHPRRPRRRRARARRSHRRPAALRHPRVQDGEAPPRSAPRPDGGRGHRVPHQRRRRRHRRHRGAAARRTTRSCSRAGRPRGATCRSPVASWPASTRRWSTCRGANRVQEGDIERVADRRRRQARRDHRRRRHRRRLSRHRASSGRGVGHAARDHAAPARRPGRREPVAAVEPDPAHVRRRTRRVASASTASTPSASSTTATGSVRALLLHEVEMVDGRFTKIEGTERELPADFVLPGDGLRRAGEGLVARPARGRRSTSAATSLATTRS